MYPTLNNPLGESFFQNLLGNVTFNNPTTGRTFFVAKSSITNGPEIQATYGSVFYPDGTPALYTTLTLALASCLASRGDTIIIAPGHTETVSSSTALSIAKAGVTIVGLGLGSMRPAFTLDTANTATINVTANNVRISNVVFIANFLAIASLFTLTTAADFQLISCEVRDTSSILNFLAMVTTDTTSNDADGLTIQGCKFNLLATSGAVLLASALGTNDRWMIASNFYKSATTGTGAVIPIAAGKILTNFYLLNNYFNVVNATGTATGYIFTTNGSTNTGFIDGNKDHALPTTPLFGTASSGFVYGLNYHSDQADLQGYLVPGADV